MWLSCEGMFAAVCHVPLRNSVMRVVATVIQSADSEAVLGQGFGRGGRAVGACLRRKVATGRKQSLWKADQHEDTLCTSCCYIAL